MILVLVAAYPDVEVSFYSVSRGIESCMKTHILFILLYPNEVCLPASGRMSYSGSMNDVPSID
jgi:hypothetical protein